MDFKDNFPGSGGFLNPQGIIDDIGIIEKGMKVADFGSGAGYFTIPLAKKVGETGKVFAVDVLPEALEVVRSKAKIEGLNNIEIIRCNLEKENGCSLENEFCDAILLANLLFQTENDQQVIKEANRVLKKGKMVIFIEWKPDVSFGPPGEKVKKEEAEVLFKTENFSIEKEFSTDNYHYGLIFKKSFI